MKQSKKSTDTSDTLENYVEKIEDFIEKGRKLIAQKNPLEVESMMPFVKDHLFAESQAVLDKKVTQLNSRTHTVRCFGLRDSSIEMDRAGKKLADLINEVCGAYQVVGCLSEPIKVDLYFDGSTKEPESCYVCHLAFTHEAAKVIDKLIKLDKQSAFFDEGGVPSAQV